MATTVAYIPLDFPSFVGATLMVSKRGVGWKLVSEKKP